MYKYTGCLLESPINHESITQYQILYMFKKGGARSERLPIEPPEFDLDPNLLVFRPKSKSPAEASETSNAFRENIYHDLQMVVTQTATNGSCFHINNRHLDSLSQFCWKVEHKSYLY